MRLAWAELDNSLPPIDLIDGYTQKFQGQVPNIKKFFVRSPRNADCLVCPHDAGYWTKEYRRFVSNLAKEKTILVFNRGDFAKPLEIPNVIELRVGLENRDYGGGDYIILPYNVKVGATLSLRSFSHQPTISFIGYIPKLISPTRLFKSIEGTKNPFTGNSAMVRRFYLKQIKKISPNSIIQVNNFYGIFPPVERDINEIRFQFVQSIVNSDIVFCPRGDSNSSQRFYETLSVGRIPLLTNLKQVFPVIPWSKKVPFTLEIGLSQSSLETFQESWTAIADAYSMIQADNYSLFKDFLDYRKYLVGLFDSNLSDIGAFFAVSRSKPMH